VTEVRNFMELLKAKWAERKFVCVGLDSDVERLPLPNIYPSMGIRALTELLAAQAHYVRYKKYLLNEESDDEREEVRPLTRKQQRLLARAQLAFNKRIIDATLDIVCAYKPNSAFYEALGDAGWWSLNQTIRYINKVAPDVPVILDFKRGDIDNTNIGYVMASASADAITVHNYLGWKAMKPLLARENKGVFVLAKTSNDGSDEFQNVEVRVGWYDDSREAKTGMMFELVAAHVASPHQWNKNGNCGVVAGATFPEDIEKIRLIVGDDVPILAPGIGSQGGDQKATVRAAVNTRGDGFILNDSRKAIFASDGPCFPDATRDRVIELNKINDAVLAAV
jgi:orotidine-5'-phosphate decarboxylase